MSLRNRYLSLVDFASIVHHSIKNEFKGIIINPGDESYIIPTEALLENWFLISKICHDERLCFARYRMFMIY